MKLKTSITILAGCFGIFLFLIIFIIGVIKLIIKKIFQSSGIFKRFNVTAKIGKTPNPKPKLIKIFSKSLLIFKEVNSINENPNPAIIIKNITIEKITLSHL